MARPTSTQPLIPSIVDRLIDFEPEKSQETEKSRSQVIKELRESVRRDLENLLNTRLPCMELSEDNTVLDGTAAYYGIPDFSGANLQSGEGRERFRLTIENAIKHNETRFKTVSVELLDDVDDLDRSLHFRIDALLNVEPAVKPIVFDSSLEPVTRNFKVEDMGRE